MVVGPQGGFKSVTYGEQKFVSRWVDPRGTGLYEDSVVGVLDAIRENYECPVCGAGPGAHCVDNRQQPRGTHNKRRQGRGRWEIERAEAAARKAREEAEAAEQWQREMATPPAIGAVLAAESLWRPDFPKRFTVEQTYANRTVRATAKSGEQVFLARHEYTGNWYVICGQPTSMRVPCRNPLAPRCQIKHKKALQLRDDERGADTATPAPKFAWWSGLGEQEAPVHCRQSVNESVIEQLSIRGRHDSQDGNEASKYG